MVTDGRWRVYWNQLFYQSATVVVTGNTGIIATPLVDTDTPGNPIFPLCFNLVGTNMTTDETNTLTIDWYPSSAAAGLLVGTTTFVQLTASVLTSVETWPGDVTFWNVARDLVPLPPYMKITHTLAGTTKSMEYTISLSYLRYT